MMETISFFSTLSFRRHQTKSIRAVVGKAVSRRHHHLDLAQWAQLYDRTRWGSVLSAMASPIGELKLDTPAEPAQGRGVMMPRRRGTRKQEREERIAAERAINEQLIRRQQWLFAELEKRRQARAANDPPPF